MKIFHASPKDLIRYGVKRVMLTYANASDKHSRKSDFEEWASGRRPGVEMFLDSGAHSVASGVADVSLDSYCKFLSEHGHKFFQCVQLDVVGDGEATWRNLQEMESRGLRPLPVYTAEAPISHLERLCERYPYIGLGGLKGRTMGVDSPWRLQKLDKVFDVAARHWPIKFHAFGIVSQETLERYPFYSADSASAVLSAGYGWVLREVGGEVIQADGVSQGRREGWPEIASVARGPGAGAAYFERLRWSYEALVWLERHVTKSWAVRGITWS